MCPRDPSRARRGLVVTGRLTRWLRGRPSTSESTAALWAKALLDAVLFFGVFMATLPWAAHRLLPQMLALPPAIRTCGGAVLVAVGVCVLIACLNTFIRRGRGTQLPTEAPRRLVTDGLFGVVRNPIIVAELMVIWGEALYVTSFGVVPYARAASVGGHLIVGRLGDSTTSATAYALRGGTA
jgi:protein-S-isoprenylcysteine O-methyltransferase Ste14